MTDQDMRRQKADLMLEFDETQSQCLALQEKLRRIGDRFVDFGKILISSNEAIRRAIQPRFAHYGFDTEPLPMDYEKDLDFNAALETCNEFREKLHTLDDLEARAERVGATVHRHLNLRNVGRRIKFI